MFLFQWQKKEDRERFLLEEEPTHFFFTSIRLFLFGITSMHK